MGWLTDAHLQARVHEALLLDLTDDDNSGAEDTDVMAAVRADAEAHVEGRLAGRYDIHDSTTDALVIDLGAAVAIQRLFLRKNADSPLHIKEAAERAEDMLTRLAEGTASLPTLAARSDRASGTHGAGDRGFTAETLEGF